MEISLIVNIAFLVAIALVLSMMLRWDLQMLQQHSFSTADYYDWLRSTDETCSTKRIVMLAVLIGSTTTYAKESWLVMALSGHCHPRARHLLAQAATQAATPL